MVWGAIGAIASKGIDFGANYGSALLNADITRDLRRTAYQDQMHSMRAAGLNPMLAAGAQPSTSNSGSMQAPGPLSSSAKDLGTASKAGSEKQLIQAQRDVASSNAVEAKAKADAAVATAEAQIRSLDAGASKNEAEASLTSGAKTAATEQSVKESRAKTYESKARSLNLRQEWEANTPAVRADLARAQAAGATAAAGLSSAREAGTRADNVERQMLADYITKNYGLIQGGKAFDEVFNRLLPIADVVMRGAATRIGDRRERNTDARSVERNRESQRSNDQRNERSRDRNYESSREQDRRDRAEFRNFPGQ